MNVSKLISPYGPTYGKRGYRVRWLGNAWELHWRALKRGEVGPGAQTTVCMHAKSKEEVVCVHAVTRMPTAPNAVKNTSREVENDDDGLLCMQHATCVSCLCACRWHACVFVCKMYLDQIYALLKIQTKFTNTNTL